MKKFFVCLLLLACSMPAFADFPNVWYKKLPNTTVIGNVRFSHNSKMLLVIGEDLFNQIYDVETGNLLIDSIPLEYANPFFSLDDTHLIAVSGKKLINYNLQTKVDESNAELSDKDILISNVSKDQKYFLGTTDDGIRVWDLQTGKIVKRKTLYQNYDRTAIDSTSYKGECSHIEMNCDNSTLILRELTQFKKFLGVDNKGKPIYDSKYRSKINIYNVNSLDSINNLYDESTTYYLIDFALSNNCQQVAFGFQNATNGVFIYDVNSKKNISQLQLNGLTNLHLKFTPDDKYLVTASGVGGDNISLWDNSGKLLNIRNGGSYETLDISSNSKYIATSISESLYLKKFLTTGIEIEPTTSETLYPNPSNGLVNIKLSNQAIESYSIQIKDINGNNVMIIPNIISQNNLITFNIQQLQKGAYFLTLSSNKTIQNFKLIKE